MSKIKIFLTASLISLALTGCSIMMSSKMPAGSVSMLQSYNAAINGNDSEIGDNFKNIRTELPTQDANKADYIEYTQTEKNQINNFFPLLSNPSVVMYVYPHLAGTGEDQTPAPGYSTIFPLYTQLNYAMPGEINYN